MTASATWQLEFRDLTVLEDQENGDQPYFVFFGIRATPGVAGSARVFWSHFLDDDWADGVTDSPGHNTAGLPGAMGVLVFGDVVAAPAGTAPELVGWVGVAFESDSTPFSRIRDLMNDVEKVAGDQLRALVEQHPYDPAHPDASLPQLVTAVEDALRLDTIDTIANWLSSLGDPDDLIGVRAGVLVAGDPALAAGVDAPFLAQGPLSVTFTGDGASYQVTGSAEVNAGPGHTLPATVAEADADLPRRRANVRRAFGLRLRHGTTGGMPEWVKDDGDKAMRMIAAGMAVFADQHSGVADWALFSGLGEDEPSRDRHLTAFHDTVVTPYFATITPYKEIGTDGIPGKEGGDYDFRLRDLIALILAFAAVPDVLTTPMIRTLLGQGEVDFDAVDGPVGQIPFSGQDPVEWVTTGPGGRGYFRLRVPEHGIRLAVVKGSFGETENHLLGIWSWRYLVNEYLTWVASLPTTHDRYDAGLAALVAADPGRYVNGPAAEDWVLQLLGRIPHSGTFESNARPYESVTVLALMAFLAVSRLPATPGRARVVTAARTALDYLAAEYAFQSFEGKRFTPIRRNYKHRTDADFYASDYLAHAFGVLTGAYVYSDSIGAELVREKVCPDAPEGAECDLAAAAPLDDPAWAGPYYWFRIDQEGGYALWALLSGYVVPPAIHDFLLNKHGGYLSRVNTRYSQDSFPLRPANFTFVVGPAGEPDDPDLPVPRYFQEVAAGAPVETYDVAGPGLFKPDSQTYFAAPTYLNSAGGHSASYFDITAAILFPEPPFPLPDVLGPVRDLIDDGLAGSEALHGNDVFSRPSVIIPRGNVQIRDAKDIGALERQVPTMRGRDSFEVGQNLNTFKSFSLGYTFEPGDDEPRHRRFPQRYPAGWDAFRSGHFGIGRAMFVLFDFTGAPDHPLAGHYWVLGQVGKSDIHDQFRQYGRGFWEVVPGHRFATSADLAAHLQATNSADQFTDDTDDDYSYRLASSGETVRFHNRFGSSASDQAILRITDADGQDVPVGTYLFDLRDRAGLRATPLLDVWQVDRDYRFTGAKYAHADGHGRITVHNPFLGQTIELDSSDYRTPHRAERFSVPETVLPPIPGTEGQVPAVSALALTGDTLYATHYSGPALFETSTVDGELVALDPATLAVRGRVTVGRAPHAVVRHEATGRLFVVDYEDNAVSVVDAASLALVGTLTEPGFGLNGLAVSQRFGRVFVPQWGQHRVLVYDPATLALTGSMTGLDLTGKIAVDEPTDRLFVLVRNGVGTVAQDLVEYAVGPRGQTELRRLTLDGQVSRPSELAVDGEHCYVLTRAPGTPSGQQLVVVDRATFGVRGRVPLPDDGVGVAASASQRVVHVATERALITLDSHSLKPLRALRGLTHAPKRALAVDERTGTAYAGATGFATIDQIAVPLTG